MEDVIKILEIIIWPALALICVVIFKKQITNLIPNIKKIKKGDVEILFEHEMKSIQNRFQSEGSKFSNIDNALIKDKYDELLSIANFNQRKAIIDAWEIIDASLISKVMKHYPDIAMQKYIPTEYRGKSLLKEGMKPSDVEAIRILAELKNEAYSSDNLRVDKETISSFLEKTLKAAYYIDNAL